MNPNIKLTDDSGIMFSEQRDGEPDLSRKLSRDIDTVSFFIME